VSGITPVPETVEEQKMSDVTIDRPRRRLQQVQVFKEHNPHWPHTTLYKWATRRPGLIVKMDRVSLVDLDVVDEIEAGFPAANIRVGLREAVAPAQQAAAPDRWHPELPPAPEIAPKPTWTPETEPEPEAVPMVARARLNHRNLAEQK
jgi:hypothetical protein